MRQYTKNLITNYLKDKRVDITTTGKGKKRDRVYELAVSFDIETTSAYYNPMTAIYYRTDEVTKEQKELYEKRAWMYIWQMAINDFAFYGRTWNEFVNAINELKTVLNEATIIIYVHNLAYEFQFISKFFKWENIFAVDSRRPVYAKTLNGVCFKCSFLESGVGLAKLSEDLTTKKLVENLDYKTLRIPKTELTKEELAYCENDVLILTEYVNKKIRDLGSITRIKLTKTGYVREWCKHYCLKSDAYKKKISTLTLTIDEYNMCKTAFAGGFTHASAHNVGKIFDNVISHDITSSYPTVMCCEQFPMSRGEFVTPKTPEEFWRLMKEKLCIVEIQLTNIKAKTVIDNILSKSKCVFNRDGNQIKLCENVLEDNGRIVSASRIITTLTNIDFFQLQKFYTWEHMSYGRLLVYEPGYLPKKFIECIIHFYKNKTTLKDVKGSEVDYALYKSMVNSIYGMVVMDIIKDVWQWSESWYVEKQNAEEIMSLYNNSKNRFLFYPWGVFITAYARRNVENAILALGEDYIYTDTDSVKFTNGKKHDAFFIRYNEEIDTKMRRMCDHYNISYTDTRPLDIYGNKHPLGHFDRECDYKKFKTLGAKRYMVETPDGHYKTTIAGVGKTAGSKFFTDFSKFKINIEIPAGKTGKQLLSYIDIPQQDTWFVYDEQGNKEIIDTTPYIHMEDASYKMSASDSYTALINANIQEINLL